MIDENLCRKYNLVHQEVTLVMTDVQGSTELWDWYVRMSNPEPLSPLCLLHF